MTLERLLKALRSEGFKTENPTQEQVAEFIKTKNLSITDGDTGDEVDVAATFKAAKPKKVVAVKDDDDETDDKPEADDTAEVLKAAREIIREAAQIKRGTRNPNAGLDDAPQRFSIGNIERKAFEGRIASKQTAFQSADMAEVAGSWFRLALHNMGRKEYADKKRDEDVCRKANVSYDFASGGFALPSVLRNELIWLRERYSVIDMILPAIPVGPAGESFPRSGGDVTVYSPGEGVAMTESNLTGNQVTVKPVEMNAYSTVSRRMLAGSVFDFGDHVMQKLMWAVNKKQEQILFLGDGTSTYFNQQGFKGKFEADVVAAGGTWSTNAEYSAACVRGSGNLMSEITDDDLTGLLAKTGDFEDTSYDGAPIVCHKRFYWNVIARLMKSKGGVTMAEMANGIRVPTYQGVPILFSNALPKTDANGQILALYGDFRQAAKRVVVPELYELASNENVAWTSNKVAFKIVSYMGITVHDTGTPHATASSQVPGPVSFLISAES